jgi:gliding motility-associated-like protein
LDAGQYHYRITDSHDCSLEGDVTITKEWRECAVFVPNAFSPNKDGVNDLFRAKVNDDVSGFRMAIYGRWGQLIFETFDSDRGWDGKQRGVDQPTGSYLYVITFTDGKAQSRREQGTFLLIR